MKRAFYILILISFSRQVLGQANINKKQQFDIFGNYYSTWTAETRDKLFIKKDHTFEMEYEDDASFYICAGQWQFKNDTLFLTITKFSGSADKSANSVRLIFRLVKGDLCSVSSTAYCDCVSKKGKKW